MLLHFIIIHCPPLLHYCLRAGAHALNMGWEVCVRAVASSVVWRSQPYGLVRVLNNEIKIIPTFFLSVIDAMMQFERYSMEGHLFHLWIVDKWIF